MATARSHIRIDCPPADVWAAVSDVTGIASWFPGVESCTATSTGRTVSMGGGMQIQEDVVTSDPQLRRFQYRITAGIPVEHHLGTVDVLEDGAGALVVYGTDVAPDEMAALLGPTVDAALTNLKKQLESAG